MLQFFENSSLHRTKPHCLPSCQVITDAFWHFESTRSRLADDVKVCLVDVVDVNDDVLVVVIAVIVIIQMDVEKN